MARLSYADVERPETAGLTARIRGERGSVLHLYQMLLHSPPIAEGWLALLTAVRQQTTIAGSLRELVIMRVAELNRSDYEREQHTPIALAEGVTRRQLDALAAWDVSDAFSPRERAVLALTDAMTLHVAVPDPLVDALGRHFDERGIVELVTTVAAYNMVSRFLEALGIRSGDAR